jgi:hypothetical protein
MQTSSKALTDSGASIEELVRSTGDPLAATRLGKQLLIGLDAPWAPCRALELLRSASAEGSAEAMEVMATLAAAGAWTPQSWPQAFDLLMDAAEAGWARARAQLAILTRDSELASAAEAGRGAANVWRRLREAIDLEVWLAEPQRQPLCEAPRIRAAPGFITPQVCDWLVDKCRGRLKPSMMFDGQASNFLATRTCSDFVFDIMAGGVVMVLVRARISAVTRLPVAAMEPPQIFHYALGQEIKPHFDYLYNKGGYGQGGDYHGDRIATFLLYLNDDFEGGELEFPRVGVRHRGRKGDGVYFAHVDAGGAREPLSLHAARPVVKGEKFILSQWIHDRPFTANL